MADEFKIQIPNFDTTNWFNNSGLSVSNPFANSNSNVFEGYFGNTNNFNFDTFNFNSGIPYNYSFMNNTANFYPSNFGFNFSSLMSSFPIFNCNLSFPTFAINNYSNDIFTKTSESFWQKPSLSNKQIERTHDNSSHSRLSGKEDKSYASLSKAEAYEKAQKDSNLEKLTGGTGWSVSESSFITDIPFAKKGTSAILDEVAKLTGENLVITSALGTGQSGNPHQKKGYTSHHNATNPKLDIRAHGNAKELANKLKNTGYFSWVLAENDHVDVQIDIEKFENLA